MKTIQEIRKATGLSQSKFSKLTGIPASSLKKWEQGDRECPAYVTEMLAYRVQHDPAFHLGQEEADMHNLEIKEKLVKEGKSRVFENWRKFAGITMEDFLEGLRWLCEDPMTDGRMTRELGCVMPANAGLTPEKMEIWGPMEEHRPGVDGLHRLKRCYYEDGSFAGFYDEGDRLWGGAPGHASISCKDKV